MSKNIVYIGNKLEQSGRTSTTIDTLGPLLESLGYKVRYASHKKALILRFLHMITRVYQCRYWAHYVLIDTYSTRNFWYAITIGKLCKYLKIKYIPLLHGGNLPARLQENHQLVQSFLNNAHVVVSPSDFLGHAFAEATTTSIHMIHNNIQLAVYPFLERPVVKPVLLWVRSFASIYNPMMAINVLKKVRESIPDAQLIMVGPDKDGSMQACKDVATSEELPVTFTGLLTRDEWVALSKDCGVFINTSNFDNLPVSLIEAMALGLPVVSTRVGGIPFLITDDDTGYLVAANDDATMAKRVVSLINNPAIVKRMAAAGLHKAAVYDWNVVKEKWIVLLE